MDDVDLVLGSCHGVVIFEDQRPSFRGVQGLFDPFNALAEQLVGQRHGKQ